MSTGASGTHNLSPSNPKSTSLATGAEKRLAARSALEGLKVDKVRSNPESCTLPALYIIFIIYGWLNLT